MQDPPRGDTQAGTPGAELIAQARYAAGRAYVPYSHFRVGAVLTDANGTLYTGCNVEAASYGLTVCAERTAILAAIAAGARRPFTALAVCSPDTTGACMPCGACREVMHEHFAADAPIYVAGFGQFTPAQLLPYPFTLDGPAAP